MTFHHASAAPGGVHLNHAAAAYHYADQRETVAASRPPSFPTVSPVNGNSPQPSSSAGTGKKLTTGHMDEIPVRYCTNLGTEIISQSQIMKADPDPNVGIANRFSLIAGTNVSVPVPVTIGRYRRYGLNHRYVKIVLHVYFFNFSIR